MLFGLLTFALLASAITANKIISYSMSPVLLVGIRMLLAGLILLVLTITSFKNRLNINIIKNNFINLIIITLCTNFLPSILKAYSLKNLPSSNMAFFGALDPFITAIMAYFMFCEKLNRQEILGIAIGFLGSLVLITNQLDFTDILIKLPEFAIILSITISRFGWMQAQKLLKSDAIRPIQLNAITMTLSGIISLFIALISNKTNIISLSNCPITLFNYKIFKYLINYTGFNGVLIFFILYTTIIGNVIAYNLYGHLLKKYSSVYISLLSFSVPIFVYIYGILFLNERLTLRFIIACIITFIGLTIFSCKKNK